jgi:hypothetical protein
MENRIANGRPLADTEKAVAADVIAKLAGVSGKDVSKVLVALHALSVATGLPTESLARVENIPTEPYDSERFEATSDFVTRAVHQLQKSPTRHILHELRWAQRFGKGVAVAGTTIRSTHCPLRVVGG